MKFHDELKKCSAEEIEQILRDFVRNENTKRDWRRHWRTANGIMLDSLAEMEEPLTK